MSGLNALEIPLGQGGYNKSPVSNSGSPKSYEGLRVDDIECDQPLINKVPLG